MNETNDNLDLSTNDNNNDLNSNNEKNRLESINENNNSNKKNNKKTIWAISLLAVTTILIASKPFFFNKNSNDSEELPTFTMEDGEIVLGDIIEDDFVDKNYTFNLPENVIDASKYSINLTDKSDELFTEIDADDEYISSTCYELHNRHNLEMNLNEDKTLIKIIEYDENFKIYKNFVIKNKDKDTEFDLPIVLNNNNVFFVKNKCNEDDISSELVIYDSKGNLKHSEKITNYVSVYNTYYSKEHDKLLVVFNDSSNTSHLSLYDSSLNIVGQFEIGKDEYVRNIFSNKNELKIFSVHNIFSKNNELINQAVNIKSYDFTGKLLSAKTEYLDVNASMFDIQKTYNGFIITTVDISNEDIELSEAMTFIKINEKGNVEWKLDSVKNSDELFSIFDVSDGIIALSEYTVKSNEKDEIQKHLPTIIKYDYSGKEIWKKHIDFQSDYDTILGYSIVDSFETDNNQIEIQVSSNNPYKNEILKFTIDKDGLFITNK